MAADMDRKIVLEDGQVFFGQSFGAIGEKILEIVDIIPVSTSYIAEELFKKGENLSMPALMTTLMDMTGCGKIAQNGAYYRRIA